MATLKALCVVHEIRLEATSLGFHRDETGWEHELYTCTLWKGRKHFTTSYRMGMGLVMEPTAEGVLESLLSDASAGTNSFEDFCSEFGYSTDSRKAHATWEACVKTAKRLPEFLGKPFEDFQNADCT